MKKGLLLLAILFAKFSFAQHEDTVAYMGIYMTAQDYGMNKLSYAMSCNPSTGKIKTEHFFSQKYVEVTNGSKKIKLNKDSIDRKSVV